MPASFALAAYALRAILALSPLGAPREVLPGWDESQEARWHRMRSIASDIADAAAEACAGRADDAGRDRCERWSVAALVGTAAHESDFAPDTDAGGKCYRKGAHIGRCDGDLAATIYQMHFATQFKNDRLGASREALRRLWGSVSACRHLPPRRRLAQYASGTCGRGHEAAEALDRFIARALGAM